MYFSQPKVRYFLNRPRIFWGSAERNKKHTTDMKGLFIYTRLTRKTAPISVHYEHTYISETITWQQQSNTHIANLLLLQLLLLLLPPQPPTLLVPLLQTATKTWFCTPGLAGPSHILQYRISFQDILCLILCKISRTHHLLLFQHVPWHFSYTGLPNPSLRTPVILPQLLHIHALSNRMQPPSISQKAWSNMLIHRIHPCPVRHL